MPFIERLKEGTEALTLTEVKAWLKVEHDLDDKLLEQIKEASINEAYNFTQNDFEHIGEEGELVLEPIPFNVKIACLTYCAYVYEHRGEENIIAPPFNCIKLLCPYRKLVGL